MAGRAGHRLGREPRAAPGVRRLLHQVLNQIGFKATEKIIADAQYFPTIGNLKTNPQTGFADWNQDFPNPIDFYLLIDAKAIQPTQQPELQPGQRPEDPERR